MDVNNTLVEYWNKESIKTIYYLQHRFNNYEWWIVQASVYGDNREAFTFFFPFFTGLVSFLGSKVLWSAILVEWSNLILKWIFKGDRPYWWLHESDSFGAGPRPLLKQFPNTCESGPGTPSGHIMINTAVFFVVARGLTSYFIWNTKLNGCLKFLLSLIIWALYFGWISVVFISRLYIQAHFIHQCVLGVVLGLFVGQLAWKCKWLIKSHRFASILFANFLIGSSLVTYVSLLHNGLDPLWAIPLAMKHCINPAYVRVDTQPYFIMTRFTAASLGLGFGLSSKKFAVENKAPKSIVRTLLKIKAGLLVGRMVALIQSKIPTEDMVVYLTSSFTLYMIFPYTVIALVPHFILSLYPPS